MKRRFCVQGSWILPNIHVSSPGHIFLPSLQLHEATGLGSRTDHEWMWAVLFFPFLLREWRRLWRCRGQLSDKMKLGPWMAEWSSHPAPTILTYPLLWTIIWEIRPLRPPWRGSYTVSSSSTHTNKGWLHVTLPFLESSFGDCSGWSPHTFPTIKM